MAVIRSVAMRGLTVAATEEYVDAVLNELAQGRTKRKYVIKDMRLFYNSIDKAVDLLKNAGISAASKRTENEKEITLTITIPKEL